MKILANAEPIECMASIGTIRNPKMMKVQVNPDPSRIGTPYFKVYMGKNAVEADSVARICFESAEYVSHRDSYGCKPCTLNRKERDALISFMRSPRSFGSRESDNWNLAKYHWNDEYGFFDMVDVPDGGYDTDYHYLNGYYDDVIDHPSYLPSTLVMPDYSELD